MFQIFETCEKIKGNLRFFSGLRRFFFLSLLYQLKNLTAEWKVLLYVRYYVNLNLNNAHISVYEQISFEFPNQLIQTINIQLNHQLKTIVL